MLSICIYLYRTLCPAPALCGRDVMLCHPTNNLSDGWLWRVPTLLIILLPQATATPTPMVMVIIPNKWVQAITSTAVAVAVVAVAVVAVKTCYHSRFLLSWQRYCAIDLCVNNTTPIDITGTCYSYKYIMSVNKIQYINTFICLLIHSTLSHANSLHLITNTSPSRHQHTTIYPVDKNTQQQTNNKPTTNQQQTNNKPPSQFLQCCWAIIIQHQQQPHHHHYRQPHYPCKHQWSYSQVCSQSPLACFYPRPTTAATTTTTTTIATRPTTTTTTATRPTAGVDIPHEPSLRPSGANGALLSRRDHRFVLLFDSVV